MKKVRDSQRSKVYQWESNNIPNIHAIELTLYQCELLIAESISWWFRLSTHQLSKAERDKGIQLMPIIKNGRGIRKAKGNASKITLPRWARSKAIVLHETAHCIVDRMGQRQEDGGHGPYFMRTYIELIGHFLKLSRTQLTKLAREDRIRVMSAKYLNRPSKITALLADVSSKLDGVVRAYNL